MNTKHEKPETQTEAPKVDQSELIKALGGIHVDVCDTCDGSGWLRANRSEGGKYIFGKELCYACDGHGQTEYVTCPDCGSVTPAKYAAEHVCGD